MNTKTLTETKTFDQKFDDGESIVDVDMSTLRRPGRDTKRVNIDFTVGMVMRLDEQARKRGVTRQALIKMWIADRLDATD